MDLTKTRADLVALMQHQGKPAVSIFLPTHRAGNEIQQDPIRLKNLLARAEEKLLGGGMKASETREFLAPAHALVDDEAFWRQGSDGLALFVARGATLRRYRLPIPFRETLVVGERFHLKPLLPALDSDHRFYVLAVSLGSVRLVRATEHNASELPLPGVPRSLDEVLRYDEPEQKLERRTRSPNASGTERGALFHTQGAGYDDRKEDIRRFLTAVDRGLRRLLNNETAPLVVAGIDYLLPIYREVNTYGNLTAGADIGNHEMMKANELRQAGWPYVRKAVDERRAADLARFHDLQGTGRVSGEPREVIQSAHYGRVDTLFLDESAQQWGRLDAQAGLVELHDTPQDGDEDLFDRAAIRTFESKGTVHLLSVGQVPGGNPIAAIYRY